MHGIPVSRNDAHPADILREAGRWLAEELGNDWRFLRSRGTLKHLEGGYVQEIHLQGSTYNRTGASVDVDLGAVVRSKALAEWRSANADRVLGSGGRVYGTLVVNLLPASYGHFDLTDDARRRAELPRMLNVVRDVVIPYLELALEPDRLLQEASAGTAGLAPDSVLESFLSIERADAAQALVEHAMDTPWKQGVIEGAAMAADGIRPLGGDGGVAFGWVAAKFGLRIPIAEGEWRLAVRRFQRDTPDLDRDGYLDPGGNYAFALSVTTSDGEGRRTYFQAFALESALRACGEDDIAERVARGLQPAEVERIGRRHADLTYTTDPDVSSGAGYPSDKAFAVAAVEVLEGSARPLARNRRRPT